MTLKSSLESDADTSMVKPDGPAVAALLALGIGAAVLGFLTTLTAASTTVKGVPYVPLGRQKAEPMLGTGRIN